MKFESIKSLRFDSVGNLFTAVATGWVWNPSGQPYGITDLHCDPVDQKAGERGKRMGVKPHGSKRVSDEQEAKNRGYQYFCRIKLHFLQIKTHLTFRRR